MSPVHSCPDESDITNITSFLQECKAAKYLHSQVQDIEAYSLQPTSTSDMIQAEQERKSIIPDIGLKNPTSDLSHLSPPLQARMQSIIEKHKNLFSRSKHHLGHFKGFKATAEIDKQTRINCRQAPRNRVLPSSCKQDLLKYRASGLFDNSTGLADHYCANITLVLRNQVKEQRDNTKAGKYVQKQETKNKGARKKTTGTEHDMSTIEVKPVDSQTPDSQ